MGVVWSSVAHAQPRPALLPEPPRLKLEFTSNEKGAMLLERAPTGVWVGRCSAPCTVQLTPGVHDVSVNSRKLDRESGLRNIDLRHDSQLHAEVTSWGAERTLGVVMAAAAFPTALIFATATLVYSCDDYQNECEEKRKEQDANFAPVLVISGAVAFGMLGGGLYLATRKDRIDVTFTPGSPPARHGKP